MGDRVMKTKITLGESVKTKVNRSVGNTFSASVDDSVWISVYGSLRSSINNLMIWEIEL